MVTPSAVVPDTVRRGLMDALGENMHLRALGLHWLANVKDAVRLNQVGGLGLTRWATVGLGLRSKEGWF